VRQRGGLPATAGALALRLVGGDPHDQAVLLRRGGIPVLLPHVVDDLLGDKAVGGKGLQDTGTARHLFENRWLGPRRPRAPSAPPTARHTASCPASGDLFLPRRDPDASVLSDVDAVCIAPEALQLVVLPLLRVEDMDNEVQVIEEHPAGLPVALSAVRLHALG